MSTPPSAPLPPSKPRKKRQAEEVSFEDLLAAHKTERSPGQLPPEGVVLIGVDLELQRRMAEKLAVPGSPTHGAPQAGAPNVSDAKFGAPLNGALPVPTVVATLSRAPEPDYTDTSIGAPDLSAPNFDVRDLIVRPSSVRTYAIRPISRIEDVFTSAERDLLRWLWEHGHPVPGCAEIRLVTGPNGEGARRLAAQASLIYNTFKNLTRALATKLALDIVKPERNLPTIYAIYDNHTILGRQRRAGYTGVVHKNGGGRELVTASAEPAPKRADLTIPQLQQMISARNFGTQNSGFGAPNFVVNPSRSKPA